ncbi:MAG TPA: hypothetical protein VI756_10920 [Blastocatellia bacterium]
MSVRHPKFSTTIAAGLFGTDAVPGHAKHHAFIYIQGPPYKVSLNGAKRTARHTRVNSRVGPYASARRFRYSSSVTVTGEAYGAGTKNSKQMHLSGLKHF